MNIEETNKFSIEFYPPRSADGEKNLDNVHAQLTKLKPDFFSVTYGAGGSTKKGTERLVLRYAELGSNVAPHLSFGGTDDEEVRSLLRNYKEAGIARLVALRGDLPSTEPDHQRYASELVTFIRKETGEHFHIDVACYPESHPDSKSYEANVEYFKQKVESGANSAITQYFYNADAYFRFVEYCQYKGIDIPIVPGIMPITNYQKLSHFSSNCGAEIPRWLRVRLEDFGDNRESLKEFGIEFVTELCGTLLDGGAPGLHFYSMNLAGYVTKIWDNLSLSER
ncbi:MAG: methylenetetrahydrofolate reductase [NAD(P)H] [Gammaproteobacteria bacterium]|nr:methylenetetrahydrofolate reductase [NAD(P)H] [Gammaproteobacteria bacterium]|tara:strand:- start:502 stop:1344 length:843 start_codon:yes stop_codon:yes gene_type:complete